METEMKLNQEQNHVIQELAKLKKQVQTLGGYAGTGKTSVVSSLSQILSNFAVCAYTGKAANVLRRKGVQAATIHSTIYKAVDDGHGGVHFILREPWDFSHSGFIVDEASMVSKDIKHDLLHFNIPIIFVGDHGQLEPVGDDVGLMQYPDYRLETIHRNAGEIAHFAEWVRKENRASDFANHSLYTGDKVQFVSNEECVQSLAKVNQIICAFNKTRVGLNNQVREQLGYSGNQPNVGEKVMCLRNNKQKGLFNGMQGTIKKLYPRTKYSNPKMVFETYEKITIETFYDKKQFGLEKYEFNSSRDEPDPFDFAYAITCHKAQGDEWDDVMIMEQECKKWSHARWAYTAASRAKNKVVWV